MLEFAEHFPQREHYYEEESKDERCYDVGIGGLVHPSPDDTYQDGNASDPGQKDP